MWSCNKFYVLAKKMKGKRRQILIWSTVCAGSLRQLASGGVEEAKGNPKWWRTRLPSMRSSRKLLIWYDQMSIDSSFEFYNLTAESREKIKCFITVYFDSLSWVALDKTWMWFMQENVPLKEVFDHLKCTRDGLSSDEVQERLDLFGYNKLEEKKVRNQLICMNISLYLFMCMCTLVINPLLHSLIVLFSVHP